MSSDKLRNLLEQMQKASRREELDEYAQEQEKPPRSAGSEGATQGENAHRAPTRSILEQSLNAYSAARRQEKRSFAALSLQNALAGAGKTSRADQVEKRADNQVAVEGNTVDVQGGSQEPDRAERPKSTPQIVDVAKTFLHETQPDQFTAEQMETIKQSLQMLLECIEDREMVSQALTSIMNNLQQTPELAKILKPEGIGLMVRALRQSFGVQVAKKSERAQKREAAQKDVNETLEILRKMNFGMASR